MKTKAVIGERIINNHFSYGSGFSAIAKMVMALSKYMNSESDLQEVRRISLIFLLIIFSDFCNCVTTYVELVKLKSVRTDEIPTLLF